MIQSHHPALVNRRGRAHPNPSANLRTGRLQWGQYRSRPNPPCAASAKDGSASGSDTAALKVTIAKKYYETVWSSGDLELADEVLAEDHIQHDRGWWGGRETVGRDQMCKGIKGFRRAYPDLKFTVEEVQANEEALPSKVFVHWRADGTNTGGMFGKEPTGDPLAISGISMLTIDVDGKIQSSVVYRQASNEELYGALEAGLPVPGEKQD